MAELSELNGATVGEGIQQPRVKPENERKVLFWRIVFILVPMLFVAILGWRLWQTNKSEHRADGTAPPFEFTTFDGETITLESLRGQGVVLNFWASWCDPCREEAVLLEETWRREKANGIMFIGLDYLDQEPAALKYLQEFDITYPNGPDLRSQVARRYGIKGVPETFFIDPEGKITDIIIGPIVNQAQMDQLIDKIRPARGG
jgi:cytochrome c biogenesis protein CcmG, thiol:disulfide interchange protein DsbE